MPLFSCPLCGWTTTASLTQAVRAHGLGAPKCDGVLEPMAYVGKRLESPGAIGERFVVPTPSSASPTTSSPEP